MCILILYQRAFETINLEHLKLINTQTHFFSQVARLYNSAEFQSNAVEMCVCVYSDYQMNCEDLYLVEDFQVPSTYS